MRRNILTLITVTIIVALLATPGLASPPKEGGGETIFLQLDLSEVVISQGMSPAQVLGAYRLHQGLQVRRIIGLLVYLKDKGLVASFEPDFDNNGILVTTTGAEGVAALHSSPGLFTTTEASPEALERSAEAFHAAILASMKAAREVAEVNGTFWTYVELGDDDLWGEVAPSTTVWVTLKDASGNIVATARTVSESDGDWGTYFRNGQRVWPGYRVIVKSGGITKSIVVPKLTILANRNTDISSGKGPANKTVVVGLYHCYLTASGRDCDWYGHAVLTDGSGNYSYDFTSDANMIGLDLTYVQYEPNANWTIYRGIEVPGVYGGLGHNYAWGYYNPFTQITVILKNSANVEKARTTCRTNYWGWFWMVEFYNASGKPVMVRPNDKITVKGSPGGITATMINLTANADAAANTVSGKAKPNQRVEVELRHYTSEYDYDYYEGYPKANSAGNYSYDFTGTVNMVVNDAGYVWYPNPNTGDGTEVWFIAQ
jgi:hypothetical protein